MSKIALQGDSAGTGTFTISAPNSSANPVLTLPTSSGTVVVTGGAQTIEFAAGSASTPSITFTGDTNTGIFSPAADTIAFAEGGAEAARLDSSGNLLVGTTTAVQKLTVNGYASVNGNNISADNSLGFRNRIINGDMRIAQRGTSETVDGGGWDYLIDRFAALGQSSAGVFTYSQDSDAPAGFQKSLKVAVTTADGSLASGDIYTIRQTIEGFNSADFGWGTANAKTITLSFWVRSSLTGTFGGALNNEGARSYPFTYSISSANTWEYKTITIAGDTSGTWGTTNSHGVRVTWGLGVGTTYSGTAGAWAGSEYFSATGATSVIGTLNATWFITGVQLEVGSVATPFERRPYGTELALCQRYFQRHGSLSGNYVSFGSGRCSATTSADIYTKYTNTMRAAPTLSQSGCGINGQAITAIAGTYYGNDSLFATFTVASGLTTGGGAVLYGNNNASAYIDLAAEL